MAMATPVEPGKTVRDGYRFQLEEKEPGGWQDWKPPIPLIYPNLPPGTMVPRLVRGTLKYRIPGRLYGTRPRERRGLLLPVDKAGLLTLADLLSVPARATSVELAFEGIAQPISAGNPKVPFRWLEGKNPAIKEWLSRDRLRAPTNPEDCLLVADSSSNPLFVSVARLQQADSAWTLDDRLAGALTQESWNCAAVVSVQDGKVIGLLLVPEDGPKRIIPLTKEAMNPPRP